MLPCTLLRAAGHRTLVREYDSGPRAGDPVPVSADMAGRLAARSPSPCRAHRHNGRGEQAILRDPPSGEPGNLGIADPRSWDEQPCGERPRLINGHRRLVKAKESSREREPRLVDGLLRAEQ